MEDDSRSSDQQNSTPTKSGESWWGAWSQGWMETVKEKSAVTMEMVKKDLNEFVEVIQGDTSVAISKTASKLDSNTEEQSNLKTASKVVKKGVSKFLHSVSELMAVAPDDSQEELISVTDDASLPSDYNRKQEKLHAIQTDPGTYCNEPEGLYSEWIEVFNLDEHKQEMSNMLVQNPAIRAIYTQLVPAVVSHTTFWQRYFYRVFLLEAEEKKREEIVARANIESTKEEPSDWDDDDDDIEVISAGMASIKTDNTCIMENSLSKTEIKDTTGEITTSEVIKNDDIPADFISDSNLDQNTLVNRTDNLKTGSIQEMLYKSNDVTKDSSTESGSVGSTISDSIMDKNTLIKRADSLKTSDTKELLDESSDLIKDRTTESGRSSKETINIVKAGGTSHNAHCQLVLQEPSETSSLSSWMSIDDVIKVKKISGEQEVKSDTNGCSANISSDSNGVMISQSDAIDASDEDFDIDIEEEVNEEEIAKMVQEIKNKSVVGTLQDDDDDWENWE